MPKFKYSLSNGKNLVLEGDTQPSDEEVESIAGEQGVQLKPVAPSRNETTSLNSNEEPKFQEWIKSNNITDLDHPDSHYDYRGFWKENPGFQKSNPEQHFTDKFKQHGHPSFSRESQYSKGENDGGKWEGNNLVDSKGNIIFSDEIPAEVIPPQEEDRSLYEHIFKAPKAVTDFASQVARTIDAPSLTDAPTGEGGFGDYFRGVKARGKGFLAGALEGASELLSPANLLTMGRGRLPQLASQILGGAQTAHGAIDLSKGDISGLGDIGFGALGLSAPHISSKTKVTPKEIKPVVKSTPKPTAEFLGLQQDGQPLFNIKGGPKDRSTVGLDQLKELGIETPPIPSDAVPMRGEQLREQALKNKKPEINNQERANEQSAVRLERDLQGAKPRFNIGTNSYEPQFDNDLDKALFIIAQKTPSKRDADYLKYVMEQTGLSNFEARQAGLLVRAQIKNALKGQEPGIVKIPALHKSKSSISESMIPNKGFKGTVPDTESPIVYHGTQDTFNNFETTRNKPQGLFSNMTRFTENPEYSQLYSLGETPSGMKRQIDNPGNRPNTIAAKIGAKNVLDLTKPISSQQLNELQTIFPELKGTPNNEFIQDVLSRTKTPIPFDAIRYSEHGQTNWAVPEGTPLKTPQGVPLNETIQQRPPGPWDTNPDLTTQPSLFDEDKLYQMASDKFNMGRPNPKFAEQVVGPETQFGNPPNKPPSIPIGPEEELTKFNQMGKMANESQKKSLWGEVRDANRALLTSLDFSAPGRQGKPLLLTKAYWTSLDDMMRAWGSERAAEAINESIKSHPNFQSLPGKKSLAERAGLKTGGNEEVFQSNWAEALPGVTRSKRAYNAFLDKLRSDHFNTLIDDYEKSGVKIKNDDVKLKALASFINDATGRGSLGRLEKAAPILNELFFAPKLMASRVNMYKRFLNPMTYSNEDPIIRRQALKSLLSIVGFGTAVGELARLGGAEISNEPTSSDFRKIKIGNTRVDPFSGFQQYAVGANRLISGKTTSSTSGKQFDLTSGKFGMPTRGSIVSQFMTNKLAPIPSLVWSWLEGKEFNGVPFDAKQALLSRTVPIVMQDLYDLQKEDPKLLPLGILPIMGEGLQTYGR